MPFIGQRIDISKSGKYTPSSTPVIPSNAIRDPQGNPILDPQGNYILDPNL